MNKTIDNSQRLVNLRQPPWVYRGNSVIPSLALVDIREWTPMIVLICLAGLTALPHDSLEAAIVDGAFAWRTIRCVTWPMLLPTITVAALTDGKTIADMAKDQASLFQSLLSRLQD